MVIDILTKYAHFIEVRRLDSTKQKAKVLFKNVYKLYRFPKIIVSDRDPKFKGKFWREIANKSGLLLIWVHLTIPKNMVSRKLSINAWKHTFVVLSLASKIIGSNGCILLNGAIIAHIIHHPKWYHSKLFIDMNLRLGRS